MVDEPTDACGVPKSRSASKLLFPATPTRVLTPHGRLTPSRPGKHSRGCRRFAFTTTMPVARLDEMRGYVEDERKNLGTLDELRLRWGKDA